MTAGTAAAAVPLHEVKLQLLTLAAETRRLRESERQARDDLSISVQARKRMEEEHAVEIARLRSELAARDEMQHKFERKVIYLQSENEMLERKEKDLKESLSKLLQSRDTFIHHYEESCSALQRSIQMKNKELDVLSDKLNAHLTLFNSVENEAAAVKRVLCDVQNIVTEKEQLIVGVKDKVQRISTLEKEFVEKIKDLENQLSKCQSKIREKELYILELSEHLKEEKLKNNFQPQLVEFHKALRLKDEIIQRLTSDKQAMGLELHNLEVVLKEFQDFVGSVQTDDRNHHTPASVSKGVDEELPNIEPENSLELKFEAAVADDMDNDSAGCHNILLATTDLDYNSNEEQPLGSIMPEDILIENDNHMESANAIAEGTEGNSETTELPVGGDDDDTIMVEAEPKGA